MPNFATKKPEKSYGQGWGWGGGELGLFSSRECTVQGEGIAGIPFQYRYFTQCTAHVRRTTRYYPRTVQVP